MTTLPKIDAEDGGALAYALMNALAIALERHDRAVPMIHRTPGSNRISAMIVVEAEIAGAFVQSRARVIVIGAIARDLLSTSPFPMLIL